MEKRSLGKMLLVLISTFILGTFVISISWTFGDSFAGQVLGTLEGVIIILVGVLIGFWKDIKKLFKKK